MKISITQNKGPVPITFIRLEGKLDGSNYMDLVGEAERLYDEGTRDLLLDLSKVNYMSSAGIVALHTVAMLFRGKKRIVDEEGWSAYRSIARDRDDGPQAHVKLYGLSDKVRAVLEMVGYSSFFEMYTDLATAVASFHVVRPESQPHPVAANPVE